MHDRRAALLGRLDAIASSLAQRLIQVHAIDRLLDLWSSIENPEHGFRDPFDATRRAEQRFPGMGPHLPPLIQGYGGTPESGLAILAFLEARFPVDPMLAQRIKELATVR